METASEVCDVCGKTAGEPVSGGFYFFAPGPSEPGDAQPAEWKLPKGWGVEVTPREVSGRYEY